MMLGEDSLYLPEPKHCLKDFCRLDSATKARMLVTPCIKQTFCTATHTRTAAAQSRGPARRAAADLSRSGTVKGIPHELPCNWPSYFRNGYSEGTCWQRKRQTPAHRRLIIRDPEHQPPLPTNTPTKWHRQESESYTGISRSCSFQKRLSRA